MEWLNGFSLYHMDDLYFKKALLEHKKDSHLTRPLVGLLRLPFIYDKIVKDDTCFYMIYDLYLLVCLLYPQDMSVKNLLSLPLSIDAKQISSL